MNYFVSQNLEKVNKIKLLDSKTIRPHGPRLNTPLDLADSAIFREFGEGVRIEVRGWEEGEEGGCLLVTPENFEI